MVVSQNKETPIYYKPYYGEPQSGTPNSGKPPNSIYGYFLIQVLAVERRGPVAAAEAVGGSARSRA